MAPFLMVISRLNLIFHPPHLQKALPQGPSHLELGSLEEGFDKSQFA